MRVAATYSVKGGVGKTTAAVNLAAVAAESGLRVLLWDLDPQGAATFLLRVRHRVKGGARALVRGTRDVLDGVRQSDVPNLDLMPSDMRYRHLDLLLDAERKPRRRIGELLEPLADEYDWVILDCAPSISLVSEGVFDAADVLLVPVVPSPLSSRTVDQLLGVIADAGRRAPAVLVFTSMVDGRKRLHRDVLAELVARHGQILANTSVPSSALIERMGATRSPLPIVAPTHELSERYRQLWAEVEGTVADR